MTCCEYESLSARRAWIEINVGFPIAAFLLSLSARRAWIEILRAGSCSYDGAVALRKESVDRNSILILRLQIGPVALRKESVDRNQSSCNILSLRLPVALRKESVDRNRIKNKNPITSATSLSARRAWIEILIILYAFIGVLSLSARRAWIEIASEVVTEPLILVALRKESVDRNMVLPLPVLLPISSLSARRAWIEIIKKGRARRPGQVALRKESVDRNTSFLVGGSAD